MFSWCPYVQPMAAWSTAAQGFKHCRNRTAPLQLSQNLPCKCLGHIFTALGQAQSFLLENCLRLFPKVNGCYRRSSECWSMQCLMFQNWRKALLTNPPLPWLTAKLPFGKTSNTITWHVVWNEAPSSTVPLAASQWRAGCFRELSTTSSHHRAWTA